MIASHTGAGILGEVSHFRNHCSGTGNCSSKGSASLHLKFMDFRISRGKILGVWN